MIFQRASTDIWTNDSSSDVNPIIINRFVADRGCSMTGGLVTFGSVKTDDRLSCTSCLATNVSVPSWKTSSSTDKPGTDSDRISSRSGVGARSSSSGTATRRSTSAADNPCASV